ncbi:threonylcarbamoyl-AMP synthase [Candidatus Woesearchaeota archaeon]|nr:threonylcarbamoyl-AMP synthase [Candidatus Woesearchaeota archaeon]
MRILTKEEFLLGKFHFLDEIREGAIFIHPTDTIYGIGCTALESSPVRKVRELKGRQASPFSIIAPSIEWVTKNCILDEKQKEYLELLPGPYTFILKTKGQPVAKEVNNGIGTLGIRMPDHWISEIVRDLDIPIITTSANKSRSEYMTSLENLDPEIGNGVSFIVYEGVKEGKPSKLIDLTDKVKVIKR